METKEVGKMWQQNALKKRSWREEDKMRQRSKQIDAYTRTFHLYISINGSILCSSSPPSEPNKIHVLINPRASFMGAAIYLTQRDSLVITLAELVLLKILKSSTVIYRIEMCLERIQHYSSLLKTLTFQMKTARKAKYW